MTVAVKENGLRVKYLQHGTRSLLVLLWCGEKRRWSEVEVKCLV